MIENKSFFKIFNKGKKKIYDIWEYSKLKTYKELIEPLRNESKIYRY